MVGNGCHIHRNIMILHMGFLEIQGGGGISLDMSSIMILFILLADNDIKSCSTVVSALSVTVALLVLFCIAYILFTLIQRRKSNHNQNHINGMYTCTGVDKG